MTSIVRYRVPSLIGYWLLFSITLSVILLREVIFNPGLPYTRDLIFPYDLSILEYSLGAWNDMYSQHNPELNKLPLYASLLAISSVLGSEWTVKLLFLVVVSLVAFIPFVSIHLLFKDKVRSTARLAVICSVPSLLYLFNPWVVDRLSNHIYMVLGMAFTPLILVLFIRLIEKKRVHLVWAVLNGTVLALILTIASFSTHNLLYLLPLLFMTSVYYLITTQRSHRRWVIHSSIVFFMIYIGLNSYWIMPNSFKIMSGNVEPSYNFSIAEIQRLSAWNTPSNTIQMYGGGGWREVILIPPNNLPSVTLFSLIPIFSLSAILLFPKNKLVLFLGILFAFIFPLTLGTNSPIPIYDWLMSGPIGGILWLFRDPFRLVQFTIMIFSILLAFTIYRITQLQKNILIIIMILAILYSPAAYTFYNAGGNRLISSEIPTEYEQVVEFLQSDSGSHKILWLPLRQYQYYDWNNANSEVAGDVYSLSTPVPTYGSTTTSSSFRFWTYIYSNILLDYRTNNLGQILSTYDVKYIVVHKDLLSWQKTEAENVAKILSLQRDLTMIKQVGKYDIFLNLDYTDGINKFSTYSTQRIEQFRSLPLLPSGNSLVDITDVSKWSYGPNSQVSTVSFEETTMVKWDIKFSDSQERYEAKISLADADYENYDKLSVRVLPEGAGDPRIIGVVLYTDTSNFQFTRYDLVRAEWNELVFDLRAPKIDQAGVSRYLDLRNVNAIGFAIFNKYYPSQTDYTLYLSGMSLVPDPSPYNTVALLDNWPSRQDNNTLEIVKTGFGRTYLKLNASESTILTHLESYDPLWKAIVRSEENIIQLESVPTLNILNGFMIPEAGEYEIEIYYAAQDWVYFGWAITGLTASLVGLYLAKYREHIKQLKSSSPIQNNFESSDQFAVPRYLLKNPRDLLRFSDNSPQLTVEKLSDFLIIVALSLLIVLPIAAIFQISYTADIVTMLSFSLLAAGLGLRIIEQVWLKTPSPLEKVTKEV